MNPTGGELVQRAPPNLLDGHWRVGAGRNPVPHPLRAPPPPTRACRTGGGGGGRLLQHPGAWAASIQRCQEQLAGLNPGINDPSTAPSHDVSVAQSRTTESPASRPRPSRPGLRPLGPGVHGRRAPSPSQTPGDEGSAGEDQQGETAAPGPGGVLAR